MHRAIMKRPPTEKKSWGTAVAESQRAKANTFSDEKRQRLMARGLQLIFASPWKIVHQFFR
jgi:hypothetical protein